MRDVLDLVRFPIDRLESAAGEALVARCRDDLDRFGMFDLDGFVRPAALRSAVAEVAPLVRSAACTRSRHTVFDDPHPPGVPAGHPALAEEETANRTVHAERLTGTLVHSIYHFPAIRDFVARVSGARRLCPSADAHARLNVVQYEAGEALGWHFDRCALAVSLLLQAPEHGGMFEYVRDLRSDADPNHEGVAELLAGQRPVETARLMPGTLTVFRGRNTAHRVTMIL